MNDPNLIKRLVLHEGSSKVVKKDTKGYWTIGFGRNVDPNGGPGLSISEQYYLLNNDIEERAQQCRQHFLWFNDLDIVRQGVLVELCFMGIGSLLTFKKMLAAIALRDWKTASKELLDSQWRKDVGETRATDVSQRLLTGRY